MLNIRSNDSIFKFVETNDFKQLPHITLSFRPGNDFAVKQFLAFRLQEVKEDYQAVCSELTDTKVGASMAVHAHAQHSSQLCRTCCISSFTHPGPAQSASTHASTIT